MGPGRGRAGSGARAGRGPAAGRRPRPRPGPSLSAAPAAETKTDHHMDEEETPYLPSGLLRRSSVTLADFQECSATGPCTPTNFFKSMDQGLGQGRGSARVRGRHLSGLQAGDPQGRPGRVCAPWCVSPVWPPTAGAPGAPGLPARDLRALTVGGPQSGLHRAPF